MNILKTTPKGIVIITKASVRAEICEKLENCGSYHIKTIKKQCDKIESWEIIDNDINPNDKAFPKIVKLTSIPFDEVDADYVSAFAKAQEQVLTEIIKAEAASFRIEYAKSVSNNVFKEMLYLPHVGSEEEYNEEN